MRRAYKRDRAPHRGYTQICSGAISREIAVELDKFLADRDMTQSEAVRLAIQLMLKVAREEAE
jgi:20S proteasome alpha/beta subunit